MICFGNWLKILIAKKNYVFLLPLCIAHQAHQGGHRLHHYTPHPSFYLNKDVKPDGLDGRK
jgi:hypothetical protein